jgi:hypothetical protein
MTDDGPSGWEVLYNQVKALARQLAREEHRAHRPDASPEEREDYAKEVWPAWEREALDRLVFRGVFDDDDDEEDALADAQDALDSALADALTAEECRESFPPVRAVDLWTDLPRTYRGRVVLAGQQLLLFPSSPEDLDHLHSTIFGTRGEGWSDQQWLNWAASFLHGRMNDAHEVEPNAPWPA